MYWKSKVIILITILFLTACSGPTPSPTLEVPPTVTRFPPSATPTPLIMLTATTIPSYTPTSPSSSIFTMIVLDASAKMTDPFDGKTKWDAARESAQTILDGLAPEATYGLVVIGGSATNEGVDLCNEPSVARVPFSARSVVTSQIDQLQPSGGGSLYSAFFLARRQFEGLPVDTIKTLVMITDGADECRSQDEWLGLESLFKVMNEADVEFHSEVIVLDEQVNPTTQTVVDRINSLKFADVNFQLITSNDLLEAANNSALSNLRTYTDLQIANKPTNTPDALGFSPTPESGLPTNTLSASSYTLTPKPGTPTFTPTITFTSVPRTETATLTPTITHTPTPTQAAGVELLSFSRRTNGIGCQVDIVVKVSGSPAVGSFHVMNSGNQPVGEVFQEVTLPVGIYGNNIVALNGNRPETYTHEVWFEFNGIQSNHLTGLKCLFVPTATPTP